MKSSIIYRTLVILVCLVLGSAIAGAQTTGDDTPLTNTSILKLVKANFKEKTIIAIIDSRPSRFDLSTERMIELKRSGVSEKIILAMLAHQQGLGIDNWDDEAFFEPGLEKPGRNGGGTQPAPGNGNGNSTDIFGSSGGVRGSTRSRGQDGSTSGDTITTGSATVRILRRPSEAGGAPLKLEKVATLTNDSIVELVEAGFSEGTIIRRIEQSPVEFDLSPAKLDELRKQRVSEKILSAMKTAAGDTGDATAPRSNGAPVK